jgi:parvulin-like peptidyl-prolyl isomerase
LETSVIVQDASPRLGFAGAGFFFACLCACAGPPAPSVPSDDPVVATFTGGVVLRSEFDRFPVEELGQAQTEAIAANDDWRYRIIDELALRKLLASEAPSGDPALAAAVAQARAAVLAQAARSKFGLGDPAVTEEEVRRTFEAHRDDFRDPERLRAQQIYIRAESDELTEAERENARKRLEAIRREVLGGADFTAMAREHSDSATAGSGGWVLLKKESNIHPQVIEELWNREIDEISEIVATPVGFHLFKIKERIPPIERSFDDVREFVRQRAVAEKRAAAEQAFVDEVGPRHGLVKDYDALTDPFIADDRAIFRIGDEQFTFADAIATLPKALVEELFSRYLPDVEKALDAAILERLLVLEAERAELDLEKSVATAIDEAEESTRSAFGLQLRLAEKTAAVDDELIREFYWQNEQRYQTLRHTDLSIILLDIGEEPLFTTLKRGEGLADRIRAGEDFTELAATYSKHYSVSRGGRMEHLSEHDISLFVQSTAKFRRMLKELPVGGVAVAIAECYVSGQLRYVQTGVIVVRKDGVEEPRQAPFEEVEDLVRANYTRRHYSELVAEIRNQVLAEGDLQVYADALPPL